MPGLARFTVRIGPDGACEVFANGKLLEWVAGVALQARPGYPPMLQLEATGEVEVEGEGIVRIPAETEDDGLELAQILDALDPEEIDRQVLAGLGFGDKGGSAAVLAWMRGNLCPT